MSALTQSKSLIYDTPLVPVRTCASDSRIIHPVFFNRRRRFHIEQRTYGISIGTGSLELSVILLSPETFTSNATSETATPSEHDAITRKFGPSSCNDLTLHF